jgi:hypothetical protein
MPAARPDFLVIRPAIVTGLPHPATILDKLGRGPGDRFRHRVNSGWTDR